MKKDIQIKYNSEQLIHVIGKNHKNTIQEALNLFTTKHRFPINTAHFTNKDWQKLGRIIKNYPPRLIITDNDYWTTADVTELIY